MSLEKFYCEEYDCGKGFSSKAILDSHTKFFHSKNVSGDFTPLRARADSQVDHTDYGRREIYHNPVEWGYATIDGRFAGVFFTSIDRQLLSSRRTSGAGS